MLIFPALTSFLSTSTNAILLNLIVDVDAFAIALNFIVANNPLSGIVNEVPSDSETLIFCTPFESEYVFVHNP